MIKLDKNLEGSSNVRFTSVNKIDKPTKVFQRGFSFPLGRLVAVKTETYDKEVNGEKEEKVRLVFRFVEVGDGKKGVFTHSEFELDNTRENYNSSLEALNRRIMHLFEATIGSGVFSDSIEAATFKEYFEAVAEEFNKHTYVVNEKSRPIYGKAVLYLKLTFGEGRNANRHQFPYFPNFVQKATNEKGEAVECLLDISTRDIITPKESAVAKSPIGGTSSGFGGASEDDFPDDLDM